MRLPFISTPSTRCCGRSHCEYGRTCLHCWPCVHGSLRPPAPQYRGAPYYTPPLRSAPQRMLRPKPFPRVAWFPTIILLFQCTAALPCLAALAAKGCNRSTALQAVMRCLKKLWIAHLAMFMLAVPYPIVMDALIFTQVLGLNLLKGENMWSWLAPPMCSMALLAFLVGIRILLQSMWCTRGELDSEREGLSQQEAEGGEHTHVNAGNQTVDV
jgi:hypothetical protein